MAIDASWRDLIARALEPNVFMDPALLRAAIVAAPDQQFVVLLAWDRSQVDARLVGVWGFRVGRSWLTPKVLEVPATPHAYLANPVLDATCYDAVLNAMLDFIAESDGLPSIVALNAIHAGGPVMDALTRVAADRDAGIHTFATRQRPVLLSGGDGKSYFEAALSSSSRKKLRQHRRRLAECGHLDFRAVDAPTDIAAALDDFIAIEVAGWKGRAGDALGCSASDAAYVRAMIGALATRRAVQIYGLYLNNKPVSMQIVLRNGGTAYTWKTTYDEALQDVSPGMLLLEDYTAAFLADPSIARVDSCSFDDSGFMAVWCDREALADLWLDARRGSWLDFAIFAKCQAAALSLRGRIKSLYNGGLRRWTKRRS